jgi:hypothetical protein
MATGRPGLPPLVLDEYDVDTGMGILEECLGEED